MTYTTQPGHAIGGASIRQRLSDLTASFGQRRTQHRTYRSTVNQLTGLTNRDLLDMGIHRADIHTIARQAAYGA